MSKEQHSFKNVCPKCGCTHFTPVRRKWSFVTGYMTNKIDLVCNNCGHVIKNNSSDNSSLDPISKLLLIGLALVVISCPIIIGLDALTGFTALIEAIEDEEFDILCVYFLAIIEVIIFISILIRKIYTKIINSRSETENKSFFSRHANIIIGIIILTAIIGLVCVPGIIKRRNDDKIQNADTLSEKENITTKSLDTHLGIMGMTEEEAKKNMVDQNFIDGLEDVDIVGYKGSITHHVTNYSDDIISLTKWVSNNIYTDVNYSKFLESFSDYYEQSFTETEYDSIASKCFYAHDEPHNCHVVTWLEAGQIRINWYLLNKEGDNLYGQ